MEQNPLSGETDLCALPERFTCSDCIYFSNCSRVLGVSGMETLCSWNPSCFGPASQDAEVIRPRRLSDWGRCESLLGSIKMTLIGWQCKILDTHYKMVNAGSGAVYGSMLDDEDIVLCRVSSELEGEFICVNLNKWIRDNQAHLWPPPPSPKIKGAHDARIAR